MTRIHVLLVYFAFAPWGSVAAEEPGSAADADVSQATTEFDELRQLAGTWILVDKYVGLEQAIVHPYVMQISENGDITVSEPYDLVRQRNDWKTLLGDRWSVIPNTTPKQLNVSRLVVEGKTVIPMAYELKDDVLVVCEPQDKGDVPLAGPFAGIDPRTREWIKRPRPAKIAKQKDVVYSVYVRGLEKGNEIAGKRIADQLAGQWLLGDPKSEKAKEHWGDAESLQIEDGKFLVRLGDREAEYAFSIVPVPEENVGAGRRSVRDPEKERVTNLEELKPFVPHQIDVTIDGTVYRGVYSLMGLQYPNRPPYRPPSPLKFSYFPDDPDRRPASVDGEEGAMTVRLKRVVEK